MAFSPGKRTKDLLMWMLSTKMMPPVGALIPVYLIFRDLGLLDTRGGLIAVDAQGNLSLPFNTEGMYRGWARVGEAPVTAIYADDAGNTHHAQGRKA